MTRKIRDRHARRLAGKSPEEIIAFYHAAGDAELDRRWTDHVQRPDSAIPWEEVRRKLMDRE
jgi:putative addiction module component (TIGR02574 family)